MTQPFPFQYAGSVSHGTLREEDLVPTFLSVLGDLDVNRANALKEKYADAIEHLEQGLEPSPDDLGWLMEELHDALNAAAPANYTFGAIEGDGSDFGFWEIDGDDGDESDRPLWICPRGCGRQIGEHDADMIVNHVRDCDE